MEIIVHIEVKGGVIECHFFSGESKGDIRSWSNDFSEKEKIAILTELKKYLEIEIGGNSNDTLVHPDTRHST